MGTRGGSTILHRLYLFLYTSLNNIIEEALHTNCAATLFHTKGRSLSLVTQYLPEAGLDPTGVLSSFEYSNLAQEHTGYGGNVGKDWSRGAQARGASEEATV